MKYLETSFRGSSDAASFLCRVGEGHNNLQRSAAVAAEYFENASILLATTACSGIPGDGGVASGVLLYTLEDRVIFGLDPMLFFFFFISNVKM